MLVEVIEQQTSRKNLRMAKQTSNCVTIYRVVGLGTEEQEWKELRMRDVAGKETQSSAPGSPTLRSAAPSQKFRHCEEMEACSMGTSKPIAMLEL